MRALMPLATLASLLMAMPLLGTVVRGDGWWVPAAVLAVAAAGVSALYRLRGWSAWAVPFLQSAVVLLLVTPLFAARRAFLGLVPTAGSMTDLAATFEQGIGDINTSAPPVAASTGVMLIIAVAFAVFAVTADFLAATARAPGMVGGLLLALLFVPLVVDDGGVAWTAAVSASVGFLLLLAVDMWARGREWGLRVPDGNDTSARLLGALRRVGVVALATAAAVLMALTVPMMVPSLRSDVFYTMADGTYVGTGQNVITTTHPLVSLRRELASDSDRTVLTYTTDAENPDYLRTYALDEFDGVNWTMAPVNAANNTLVEDDLPLPTGWPSEPEGETATTRVSMDSDSPRLDFLPMPYWARSVDVSGEWYADPDSLMVFTTNSPPTGLSFTVETVWNTPSPEELAGSGSARSVSSGFRSLPRDLDPRVEELTQTVTGEADSPYGRALALQDYFTNGSFTYDLSPPSVPEDADPLAHFLLVDPVGYCEQFAGAMAVMARQADIPARVAVGYTAGQRMGDGRWAVTAGDAHAWPELYFEDVGWVRFEPTPASSRGQGTASVPDYSSSDQSGTSTGSREPEQVPDRPEPNPSEEDAEEPVTSPGESTAPEDEEPTETAASSSGSGPDLSWLPVVGGVLAALLVLSVPALMRASVRWSRLSSLSSRAPASAAHTAWRELRDTCLDLGVEWVLAESPRATAQRLAQRTPGVRDALWRLALAEESARYAPEPAAAQGLREDVSAARGDLAAATKRGTRIRAALLPRSLAPWRRPRPAARPAPAAA